MLSQRWVWVSLFFIQRSWLCVLILCFPLGPRELLLHLREIRPSDEAIQHVERNYGGVPKLKSPLGVRRIWKRLLDGHCGIVNIKDRHPGFAEVPCQVAALVPAGPRASGCWKASEWLGKDVCVYSFYVSKFAFFTFRGYFVVLGLNCE